MYLVQEEADNGRWARGDGGREAKREQKRRRAAESGESGEHGKNVQLRNGEELCRVVIIPMPELVCYSPGRLSLAEYTTRP
jgi:hypothetical protein